LEIEGHEERCGKREIPSAERRRRRRRSRDISAFVMQKTTVRGIFLNSSLLNINEEK
jgi:hypothetical protein